MVLEVVAEAAFSEGDLPSLEIKSALAADLEGFEDDSEEGVEDDDDDDVDDEVRGAGGGVTLLGSRCEKSGAARLGS